MEIHELARKIRRLSRGDDTSNTDILLALRQLKTYEELDVVGHALEKVSPVMIGIQPRKLKTLKIAIVSNFIAQPIISSLRTLLLIQEISPEFYLAEYNQIAFELSNPHSRLANFKPQMILCLLDEQFLLPQDWDTLNFDYIRSHGREQLDTLYKMLDQYNTWQPSTFVLNTIPINSIDLSSIISFKHKALWGRLWRELNGRLLEFSELLPSAYVLDLEMLLMNHPGLLRDERMHYYASIAWHNDVFLLVAQEVASLSRAYLGLSKKCLVLDLDNTLWGGVIGDDGPANIQLGSLYPGNCFVNLQRIAKRLKQQGVILAVCSKNEFSIVEEALENHPEMLLRQTDFSIMQVNWEPKNENIRYLANQLNIGLDSLVFIDDSPFERQLVASTIPEVTVIDIGTEPALYLNSLLETGYFNVLQTTETDQNRTEMYRMQVERKAFSKSFSSPEEYLKQLEICVNIFEADEYSMPRLMQLNLRTNQFNMTKNQYTEAYNLQNQKEGLVSLLGFTCKDRFGQEGIIGGVWINKQPNHWVIQNFMMSCRVFSRKIEYAVLQYIVDEATRCRIQYIEAEYRHTSKNHIVSDFYTNAGFHMIRQEDEHTQYRINLPISGSLQPAWIQVRSEKGEMHNV
ncbi:HAD-IIIC family phosphatase [Paenibacillus polymyxa]|nr:HAD-IIIC family phosphatase [Paenibacillus polymyxa]